MSSVVIATCYIASVRCAHFIKMSPGGTSEASLTLEEVCWAWTAASAMLLSVWIICTSAKQHKTSQIKDTMLLWREKAAPPHTLSLSDSERAVIRLFGWSRLRWLSDLFLTISRSSGGLSVWSIHRKSPDSRWWPGLSISLWVTCGSFSCLRTRVEERGTRRREQIFISW